MAIKFGIYLLAYTSNQHTNYIVINGLIIYSDLYDIPRRKQQKSILYTSLYRNYKGIKNIEPDLYQIDFSSIYITFNLTPQITHVLHICKRKDVIK